MIGLLDSSLKRESILLFISGSRRSSLSLCCTKMSDEKFGTERKGVDVLFEFSGHDVRKDLELGMRVRAESCPGLHAVFIDDSQLSELHMFKVLIPATCQNSPTTINMCSHLRCEGESVERLEPAMISMTTLGAPSRNNFDVWSTTHGCESVKGTGRVQAASSR